MPGLTLAKNRLPPTLQTEINCHALAHAFLAAFLVAKPGLIFFNKRFAVKLGLTLAEAKVAVATSQAPIKQMKLFVQPAWAHALQTIPTTLP